MVIGNYCKIILNNDDCYNDTYAMLTIQTKSCLLLKVYWKSIIYIKLIVGELWVIKDNINNSKKKINKIKVNL